MFQQRVWCQGFFGVWSGCWLVNASVSNQCQGRTLREGADAAQPHCREQGANQLRKVEVS